jgi:hypothetical protein
MGEGDRGGFAFAASLRRAIAFVGIEDGEVAILLLFRGLAMRSSGYVLPQTRSVTRAVPGTVPWHV